MGPLKILPLEGDHSLVDFEMIKAGSFLVMCTVHLVEITK